MSLLEADLVLDLLMFTAKCLISCGCGLRNGCDAIDWATGRSRARPSEIPPVGARPARQTQRLFNGQVACPVAELGLDGSSDLTFQAAKIILRAPMLDVARRQVAHGLYPGSRRKMASSSSAAWWSSHPPPRICAPRRPNRCGAAT